MPRHDGGALSLPAANDRALAERCARGDVAAFTLVMRRYNQRLYRVARAALRDDAEAEDALQDAYVRAFNCLSTCAPCSCCAPSRT